MTKNHRPLWLYPLFQIPSISLGIFLVLAMLFWLLGLGRPNVAVVVALDLSTSTYENSSFNAPNTVMSQEVAAVKSYIEQSSQQLKVPNQIQVIGFGGQVVPLTSRFLSDRQQLKRELNQSLSNPNLPSQIGSGTNLNQAIEKGAEALGSISQYCRELLLVTDGAVGDVSSSVVAQAVSQGVKINALIIGADVPQLQTATATTKGLYILGVGNALQKIFKDKIFPSFNSNLRWIVLWLSAAWISFMWLLALPLDRWIFQGWLGYPMNLAGQLALGNALFWSALTPLILWQVWKLLGLPFFSSC